MSRVKPYRWVALIVWPVLGGAWGAWVGFRGCLQVQLNADSSASLFVWGFYAVFALIGLIAGAALCALIGGLVERLLRDSGVGIVAILCVTTILNVLALWQVTDIVQARYPGLHAERAEKHHRSNTPVEPAPADKSSDRNPCAEPPPADAKERQIWESECR